MALYTINKTGDGSLDEKHFATKDNTLIFGEPSFLQKFPITKDAMRRLFIGNNTYDYLLNSGFDFKVVTHPWVTFSCQDKIDMYNTSNCGVDGMMRYSHEKWLWDLKDTIKAIYFWDKHSHKYHIAVIPGKVTGTNVDVAKSFGQLKTRYTEIYDNKAAPYSFRNRIRLIPAHTELVFDAAQEGCLSPLPPFTDENLEKIAHIYFDRQHLETYESGAQKFDDLSIAMRMINLPQGVYIKRAISLKKLEELEELVDKGKIRLKDKVGIIDGEKVVHVNGPVFGDYKDIEYRKEGDAHLIFSFVPNHLLSLLMSYSDVYRILNETFKGKVEVIDMHYELSRHKQGL